ncbi:MAG: hypothetical protein KAT34_03835, partial [Candidatus Aminicenantes bacterium]|nr:hypothetical protein [Candidatus Aminicenantes bacterium]
MKTEFSDTRFIKLKNYSVEEEKIFIMQLFSLLSKNELFIAQLYQSYEQKFPTFSLWYQLAEDEKQHSSWLKALLPSIDDGSIRIPKNRFIPDAIKTVNNYLRSEIQKSRSQKISLIYALSISVSIENSLLEKGFFESLVTDSPRLDQILKKLVSATRNHLELVRQ